MGSPAGTDRAALKGLGQELLTFCDFSRGMWKSLNTENTLEKLNRESRPQTRTQVSFSTEAAAMPMCCFGRSFGDEIRSPGGLFGPIRCSEKEFNFLGAIPKLLGWPQQNPGLDSPEATNQTQEERVLAPRQGQGSVNGLRRRTLYE